MDITLEDYRRALGQKQNVDVLDYIRGRISQLEAIEMAKRMQEHKEEFDLYRGVTEISQEESDRAVTDYQDMLIQKALEGGDMGNRPPINPTLLEMLFKGYFKPVPGYGGPRGGGYADVEVEVLDTIVDEFGNRRIKPSPDPSDIVAPEGSGTLERYPLPDPFEELPGF